MLNKRTYHKRPSVKSTRDPEDKSLVSIDWHHPSGTVVHLLKVRERCGARRYGTLYEHTTLPISFKCLAEVRRWSRRQILEGALSKAGVEVTA